MSSPLPENRPLQTAAPPSLDLLASAHDRATETLALLHQCDDQRILLDVLARQQSRMRAELAQLLRPRELAWEVARWLVAAAQDDGYAYAEASQEPPPVDLGAWHLVQLRQELTWQFYEERAEQLALAQRAATRQRLATWAAETATP